DEQQRRRDQVQQRVGLALAADRQPAEPVAHRPRRGDAGRHQTATSQERTVACSFSTTIRSPEVASKKCSCDRTKVSPTSSPTPTTCSPGTRARRLTSPTATLA